MKNKKLKDIPQDTAVLLNEIADRLWSGHASVMIGAGFSKNAIRNSDTSKPFLSWNELADIFYEKLYGHHPSLNVKGERYLNPLKLAEEVCAAFGRPALEKLMHASLPDLDYSPSDLHKDLLELDWNDVFTTNYDTLLERTKVSYRRYDLVINKNDLVFSQRPRIVKLHGSFPSHRPFIITEEDYRVYPRENAPFVNTVQQSLIENTLCLIGFSGDDPNFLNWIGWIRDNLGASTSPKIFLIGALNLSSSQIKVLEQRNIGIIDLTPCASEGHDKHKNALQVFIDFLKSKKSEKNRLDWPDKEPLKHPPLQESSDEKYINEMHIITAQWKKTREAYPGWIVCPNDCRKTLWANTSGWLYGRHLKIEVPVDLGLKFWHELVWRIEKSLSPLYDHLIPTLEKLLLGFDSQDKNGLAYKENYESWLFLMLALLRYYREEGLASSWRNSVKMLEKKVDKMTSSQKNNFKYEQAIYHLFNQDIKAFRLAVKSWKPDEALPYSLAKKAGLLAELGENVEAEELLERAIQLVRSQLNLTPITTDYTYLSQEAYILFLLSYVKNARLFAANNEEDRRYIEEFNQRWTFLKRYKCDPWGELHLFEARFKGKPNRKGHREIKYSFDIGYSSSSINFGSDEEAIFALSFLRFSDDIGLPFKVKNTTLGRECAIAAIERISELAPHWAMVTLLRAGSEKSVDILFNRRSMQKMSSKKIEALTGMLLELLSDLAQDIEAIDHYWNNANMGTHYASILPEVISRLCTKCSFEQQKSILKFLSGIYKSNHRNKYQHIKNLTKRLVRSWPANHIPYLISTIISEFPLVAVSEIRFANDFPDPLDFIDRDTVPGNVLISKADIEGLLDCLSQIGQDHKELYARRIERLFSYGLLSDDQCHKFGDILWEHVKPNGFPEGYNIFLRWYFLKLPHPSNVNVEQLLIDYLRKLEFQAVGKSKAISITGGKCESCWEILNSESVLRQIGWSHKDAVELLTKVYNWWNEDKVNILTEDIDPTSERRREILGRFQMASKTLAVAVVPYLSQSIDFDVNLKTLRELVTEMHIHGVSVIETKLSIFLSTHKDVDGLIKDLSIEILSNETPRINRVFFAISKLFESHDFGSKNNDQLRILSLVSDAIKWRKPEAIIQALSAFNSLLRYPIVMDVIDDVLIGLNYLLSESDLLSDSGSIPLHDRLFAREMAAALSFTLYSFYKERGLDIPHALESWKSVCEDPEEFAEIRNKWKVK